MVDVLRFITSMAISFVLVAACITIKIDFKIDDLERRLALLEQEADNGHH